MLLHSPDVELLHARYPAGHVADAASTTGSELLQFRASRLTATYDAEIC